MFELDPDKGLPLTKYRPGLGEMDALWFNGAKSQRDADLIILERDYVLRDAYNALLEALKTIGNMTCDHGPMDFCPRSLARAVIAEHTAREALAQIEKP
ncbi:MAG: hypothetical protein Q8O76_07750 [Chloroflexota bacterium]|nr:hypothetical protein [Chloroflexota bacterium]